ncbi:MAG: hypothetical protein WBB22_14670 [Anaerolineae bacterium]
MDTGWTGNSVVKKSIWVSTVVVSLGILAYWVYTGRQQLLEYRWSISLVPLLLCFFTRSGALLLSAIAWGSVMRRLGDNTPFSRNLKLYCYTSLIRRLPTPIWFVGGRLYLYQREGVAKALTSTGIILEAGLMVFSGMLVLAFTLPLYLRDVVHGQHIVAVIALLPLVVVVVRPSVLINLINFLLTRLHRDPLAFSLHWRDTVRWIILYCCIWVTGGFILFFLINAFFALNVSHFGEVLGIWTLTGLVGFVRFLVPIGVGLREVTLAYMLSFLMPLPVAVVISLASRVWLALNDVFWVVIASRF